MYTGTMYQFARFKLNIQWDWKELGLGFEIAKPIYRQFPCKNYWIRIAIRILWLGIFIALWERKRVKTALEIYGQKERMNEISAFHYKELIGFKDDGTLDASWDWTHFGILIYNQFPEPSHLSGNFSLKLLWCAISIDYRSKQVLQENS